MNQLANVYLNPERFMTWVEKQDRITVYLVAALLVLITNLLDAANTGYLPADLTQLRIFFTFLLILILVLAFPAILAFFVHLGALIIGKRDYPKVLSIVSASTSVSQAYSLIASLLILFVSSIESDSLIILALFAVAFIHSTILNVYGLKANLKLSTTNAIFTVLIGMLIAMVVFFAIVGFALLLYAFR